MALIPRLVLNVSLTLPCRIKKREVSIHSPGLTNMKDFRLISEKQILHYLLLLILLGILFLVVYLNEDFLTGQFSGISTTVWFYLSVGAPIVHQVYVWFCWRVQLHHALITRRLGRNGFTYYSVIFGVLLISRLVFIIGLAISSANSLAFSHLILNSLAVVIALPTIYLLYSVVRYFGFTRALGIDHFDASYRDKPMVREGIFRFSGNSMYVFGLLILWIPGLLAASGPALLVAMFSHTYIWVHYYTTEKPDMRRIYGL